MAQQDVTYGRWADNPGGCTDPEHHGIVSFDSFVFNKLACRTKTTQTFYGSEALLTFVRTSGTTLELEMHIFAPKAPISGRIALFACPKR
ncbi:hypothetical protein [Xanthobacter autotrophicus]|uniref:hypothetical protein n=1 Tax=Xanthobacter autotrophicus TaxID=280 RepID=UPI00372708E2